MSLDDRVTPSRGRLPFALLALGLAFLICGSTWGLFFTPRETFMGDVYRIFYIHVPTAWNAMLALTFAFAAALLSLWRGGWKWDTRLEGGLEVGVVLSALICMQGSIWAKPTWGVWWDWDPRLTTTAVMVFAFGGILALRHLVDDPQRRATWSAVATIIAFVDVPIVYFSVKWWNSLHQMQSSPETVSSAFHWPLRINAFGILFLMSALISLRGRVAALRLRNELAPPPVRVTAPLGTAAALMALQPPPAADASGRIQGGWEYVIAAYAVSAAILIGYSLSVLLRYRGERARQDGGGAEAGQ
jgi:heme exporter protein C